MINFVCNVIHKCTHILVKFNFFDICLLGLLAFFTYPMAVITMQYIPYNTQVGFLILKEEYLPNTPWLNAFFVHVYSSMLVLLAGFTQFSWYILKHRPYLHRVLGYVYVTNILLVTGPASLLMSLYANGGLSSRIGFVSLAVLWLGTTGYALVLAYRKQYKEHRKYMIRSYALTLSAITLRAWKYAINNTAVLPPMDVYRVVAWLGWVGNLLVAEWYIYRYITHASKGSR